MNQKLMEFQPIILNYNPKNSVEPEIFQVFQHKVERTPHFTRVTEMRHIIGQNGTKAKQMKASREKLN